MIQFGPVAKKRIPALLSIAEKRLGDSYIRVEDLTDPDRLVYEAVSEKKAIGFVTGKTLSSEDFRTNLPKVFEALSRRIHASRMIGIVGSIAVDSLYSGSGVGYGLMGVLLDELDRKSYETVLMLGWKKRGQAGRKLLELLRDTGSRRFGNFRSTGKRKAKNLAIVVPPAEILPVCAMRFSSFGARFARIREPLPAYSTFRSHRLTS